MADDEAALKKRRAEFALVATTTDRWIWVADPEQAFVAAKILQQFDDGSMEVEIASSRDIKVIKKAEVGPFITRLAELKNHVDGESRCVCCGGLCVVARRLHFTRVGAARLVLRLRSIARRVSAR